MGDMADLAMEQAFAMDEGYGADVWQDEYPAHAHVPQRRPVVVPRRRAMPRSVRTKEADTRPVLVRVGGSFVDPADVSAIREVKEGLYIVDRKSMPNPQYPLWVRGEENILMLLEQFNVKEGEA